MKRCKVCGTYLDPGEWCDCESHPQPETEEAQKPLPLRRRSPQENDETAMQDYIDRQWREFFER